MRHTDSQPHAHAAELWAEKVWVSCQFGYSAAWAPPVFCEAWDLKRILSICKMNLGHFWNFYHKYNPEKSLWLVPGVNEVLEDCKVSLIIWDMLLGQCGVILCWWWWELCCWWVHQVAGLSPLSHWFSVCTARCARQCELGSPANPTLSRAVTQRRHKAFDQQIPHDMHQLIQAWKRQHRCAVVHSRAELSVIVFTRFGGQQWQPVAFLSLKEEAFDSSKTCNS